MIRMRLLLLATLLGACGSDEITFLDAAPQALSLDVVVTPS